MIEKLNGTTETVDFKVSSTTRLYHNHTAEDFPLHWHVPGEIICPIENTYQVTIAGQALTLLPHDVLIIASGELHSITAPPSGERYIVNFSNSFYEQFQELSLFFSTLHPYKLFRRADDPDLADRARVFRNYGSRVRYQNEVVGANSRLDELQAGLLRVKLTHLEAFNAERRRLAARYDAGLRGDILRKPRIRPGADSSWHQYVVHLPGCRDAMAAYLKEQGIGTIIHYPIPPHLSQAYAYLGHKRGDFPIAERYAAEVLSLPMYNGMTEAEQDCVIEAVNRFVPDKK